MVTSSCCTTRSFNRCGTLVDTTQMHVLTSSIPHRSDPQYPPLEIRRLSHMFRNDSATHSHHHDLPPYPRVSPSNNLITYLLPIRICASKPSRPTPTLFPGRYHCDPPSVTSLPNVRHIATTKRRFYSGPMRHRRRLRKSS